VAAAWQPEHPSLDRRSGSERRDDEYGRREADQQLRLRNLAATLLSFCLGLAILYVAFALIGAVDFGEAIGFTIGAIVLAGLWVLGAWQRSRSGAFFITRNERERRGF
jgi:hypothetical protein